MELLIILLKASAVFAIICIAIYIPSFFAHKEIKEMLRYKPDNTPQQDKQQVLDVYNYIDKLCRFLKLNSGESQSYLYFAERM